MKKKFSPLPPKKKFQKIFNFINEFFEEKFLDENKKEKNNNQKRVSIMRRKSWGHLA